MPACACITAVLNIACVPDFQVQSTQQLQRQNDKNNNFKSVFFFFVFFSCQGIISIEEY